MATYQSSHIYYWIEQMSMLAMLMVGQLSTTPVQKWLCEHGGISSVDVRSKGGWTPLMNAASKGHSPIVIYLLTKQAANPLTRDIWGETAYDAAAAVFEVWICEVLQTSEAERWCGTTVLYNPLAVHTTGPLILNENQRLDVRLKTLAVSGRKPKWSHYGLGRLGQRALFELKLPSPNDAGAKLITAWHSGVQLPLTEDPWTLPETFWSTGASDKTSGWKKPKTVKGEGRNDGDNDEHVEFEQFPAPFVSDLCVFATPPPMKLKVDMLEAKQSEKEDDSGKKKGSATSGLCKDKNFMALLSELEVQKVCPGGYEKLLLEVTRFIGQGTDKQGRKGFVQKEQLEVIKKFKAGEFNVLLLVKRVSTLGKLI
ncbi:hypothetical protein EV702DRAFT_1234182 [Suillus placidus]|uniref:Uncharacterized protein n=1 Tax=Suillus placidus TaxID=48579 RepID=A0A9P6ZT97_9AGAM|nr:hypothetical protein EV702DRAFT_1234182 [Suillus placidus]